MKSKTKLSHGRVHHPMNQPKTAKKHETRRKSGKR